MKTIIKNCPVCESKKISKVFSARDYLVSDELFDILECYDCSLRFTSPAHTKDTIGQYYQSDEYISHTGKGNSLINRIYSIVQYFTLRSKKRKVESFSQQSSGSILDIGCGTGKFLHTMLKSGWNVNGVEENESASKLAEENINLDIMNQADFFNSKQKYDMITMWHSLEHLHELKQYVEKISLSLNANGVLMIAVPNYKSYDAQYFKSDWAAYDVPRHLYHFTAKALSKLFNENGFELVGYQQLPFDPFYVALLSEISVRKKHNILKALFIGLKSFCQGCKYAKMGSSILYVFKATEKNQLTTKQTK